MLFLLTLFPSFLVETTTCLQLPCYGPVNASPTRWILSRRNGVIDVCNKWFLAGSSCFAVQVQWNG